MNKQQLELNEYLSDDKEIDLKGWLRRIFRIWPWFLLSVIICLGLSILYLQYAKPVYKARAAIIVKDEKKGAEIMDNSVLKEMGFGGNNKLVENEIEVLKSPDLTEGTVKKLHLFIDASKVERIKDVSVFGNEIPINLEILYPNEINSAQATGLEDIKWEIRIPATSSGFEFRGSKDKKFSSFSFGQTYKSDNITFKCTANQSAIIGQDTSKTKLFRFKLSTIDMATFQYNNVLVIEQATKLATVINLEIKDKNEEKAKAILTSIIDLYNQIGLEDKNRITDSTINFLNDRLGLVSQQLQNTEGSVQKFKTKNKVTDISVDEQQFLTLAQQVDVQKAEGETKLSLVNAMIETLSNNLNNPQLVPSTLGIEEPSLAVLIEQHNQLVLQKERIILKTGPQNPLVIDIQSQIAEIREKLLSNVQNLKHAFDLSLKYVKNKDQLLESKISNVPLLEKQLIQITRDKNVQEQIYAFLLQKREEAAITRASTIEDSRIIAQPRSTGKDWPAANLVLIAGFLLGLIAPIVGVYLRDYLNDTVGNAEQIAQQTDIPLLGSISHIKKIKSPLVIDSKSRSIAAEQIRNIRTALTFTAKAKELKIILVTSFQPGDGKSFVSLNLAASYALLDKKTLIVEFDLRKPHIAKYLDVENKEGISSILSTNAMPKDLYISIPGFNSNLFMLPAGHLPPNPAELISGPRMPQLIQAVREQFDYIIIDTPPFSLVADATLLQEYADISLVVLRQSHTAREVYPALKQQLLKHPSQAVYLLLNDVGKNKRYQGGYGYGEGYYYHDQ